jgi:hypothetical protein
VKAGTTGADRSPRLNRAFHYGMYRFYRRHYAGQRNPVVNAAVYCGIALKFAASTVRSWLRRSFGRARRAGTTR